MVGVCPKQTCPREAWLSLVSTKGGSRPSVNCIGTVFIRPPDAVVGGITVSFTAILLVSSIYILSSAT